MGSVHRGNTEKSLDEETCAAAQGQSWGRGTDKDTGATGAQAFPALWQVLGRWPPL